jgi:hypothetical protein
VKPAELQPKTLERIGRESAYSPEEWAASAGHRPLADVDDANLTALITHWRWSEAAQAWFYTLLELEQQTGRDPETVRPDDPWSGALMVYYGLVWAIIERLRELRVRLHGPLNTDIRDVAEDLRVTRNGVFHVSRPDAEDHIDGRLIRLMIDPPRMLVVNRVHLGLGRLAADEVTHRVPTQDDHAPGEQPGARP